MLELNHVRLGKRRKLTSPADAEIRGAGPREKNVVTVEFIPGRYLVRRYDGAGDLKRATWAATIRQANELANEMSGDKCRVEHRDFVVRDI